MTQSISNETPVVADRSPAGALPGRRAAALAGVAFAVLLFLGVAVLNPPVDATDTELVDWWSAHANQTAAAVSMYLFAAAAISFLGFLTHLSARIRAGAGGGQPSQLTFAAGIVSATTLAVAAAARGVVGKATALNDQPLPGADALRYLSQLASATLGVLAMLSIAATILALSYAILRTGVLGRWLAWLGIIAAAALLAVQTTFFGELAIPAVLIWTIAASIAIWRAPAPVHEPGRQRASGSASL